MYDALAILHAAKDLRVVVHDPFDVCCLQELLLYIGLDPTIQRAAAPESRLKQDHPAVEEESKPQERAEAWLDDVTGDTSVRVLGHRGHRPSQRGGGTTVQRSSGLSRCRRSNSSNSSSSLSSLPSEDDTASGSNRRGVNSRSLVDPHRRGPNPRVFADDEEGEDQEQLEPFLASHRQRSPRPPYRSRQEEEEVPRRWTASTPEIPPRASSTVRPHSCATIDSGSDRHGAVGDHWTSPSSALLPSSSTVAMSQSLVKRGGPATDDRAMSTTVHTSNSSTTAGRPTQYNDTGRTRPPPPLYAQLMPAWMKMASVEADALAVGRRAEKEHEATVYAKRDEGYVDIDEIRRHNLPYQRATSSGQSDDRRRRQQHQWERNDSDGRHRQHLQQQNSGRGSYGDRGGSRAPVRHHHDPPGKYHCYNDVDDGGGRSGMSQPYGGASRSSRDAPHENRRTNPPPASSAGASGRRLIDMLRPAWLLTQQEQGQSIETDAIQAGNRAESTNQERIEATRDDGFVDVQALREANRSRHPASQHPHYGGGNTMGRGPPRGGSGRPGGRSSRVA